MTCFVLDASVALCWCFENQATPYTEAIFQMMADGSEARVPFIWPLEMANALALGERRKALTVAQTTTFLRELQQGPIEVDSAGLGRAFHQILAAARTHKLSAYNAAYLELALREGLPIATLDKDLRTAARTAGVGIARTGPALA
ncbi:MAG TPA: type II toxin-antitoxin system VapC family toxin [Terriglobia bacterium]